MKYSSTAQVSPALGPPQAGAASIPLRKIKFDFLTTLVKKSIDKAVVDINKEIDKASPSNAIDATLSYKISSILPIYKQTENVLTPNHMIVQLVINVEYNVSNIHYQGISYLSRKIFQQILISASCDKWETNNGWSKFTCIAENPYPDETTFDEYALCYFVKNTVVNYIDNHVSGALHYSENDGELPIETTSCNCLNFKMGTAPGYNDGYVGFYYFPVRKIYVEALYSDPVVRLISIKRIASGSEMLLDTEDLQIEYGVNFKNDILKVKPIAENETVVFKDNYAINFELPHGFKILLVSAKITVLNKENQVFAGYLQFEKDKNFGEGVHKLIIMKTVKKPLSGRLAGEYVKFFSILMPAYELIFDIKNEKPK